VRLSQKTATVAEFGEGRTFLRQCGQGLTQRNARVFSFYATKKRCVLFYATADVAPALAASCGAPQANRNDFYIFSATPDGRRRTQPIRELLLRSTNACCGIAERLGSFL